MSQSLTNWNVNKNKLLVDFDACRVSFLSHFEEYTSKLSPKRNNLKSSIFPNFINFISFLLTLNDRFSNFVLSASN